VIIARLFPRRHDPKSTLRNNTDTCVGFDVRPASGRIFPYIQKKGRVWLRHVEKGSAEYTGTPGVWPQSPWNEPSPGLSAVDHRQLVLRAAPSGQILSSARRWFGVDLKTVSALALSIGGTIPPTVGHGRFPPAFLADIPSMTTRQGVAPAVLKKQKKPGISFTFSVA